MKNFILAILTLFLLGRCEHNSKQFLVPNIVDKTNSFSRQEIWVRLNDKERIGGYTRIGDSIFGGEFLCNIKPLENIDINTFEVLIGTKYAKDKKHVYFPLEIICYEYSDCGSCYYSKVVIPKANPKSFTYLGKDYATDNKWVYFRGKLINGADAKTFKVVDGNKYTYFAIDTNHVYKYDHVFWGADPSSFCIDTIDMNNVANKTPFTVLLKDKKSVWVYHPPNDIKKLE
ncbi:MAG: hypothetical protein RLZZ546_1784 [Bacteroidota bacterium]|jgi:hypothetical protein